MNISNNDLSQSSIPNEGNEFLEQVKQEFSLSLLVNEKFLSKWLKHHGDSE